jgi:hypothetical protein
MPSFTSPAKNLHFSLFLENYLCHRRRSQNTKQELILDFRTIDGHRSGGLANALAPRASSAALRGEEVLPPEVRHRLQLLSAINGPPLHNRVWGRRRAPPIL